ncbi:dimethyl sulfoxide reductase anchor subunit family protein [Xenorhabdus koppenhoeferi]|uniref:Anaerobic dimethyl sulfoxide reductase subunit C (DMSO reductase anchor subunit) n=1 Tax=Xenorhabdus koppenhoeferi TaxID=351659 RepID=A0A1I7I4W6_9GAMM|nr:DmsC/YnfH family molybdoenzyme membrane anchor subunit [Xenorhabdus koppenhoeferi]SFU67806.1 anaerobic dimethyl sulfoxide reductase subunit C (DMSO reductase anchor subunit) [Xenorhabdus koppenhoeferi]
MSEWLLIAFTMIVQSSVGLVLMSALFIYWLKHELNTWQHSVTILVQKILLRTLLVSGLLAGLGLVASLNILEYPFNIYHSLCNILQECVNIEKIFAAIYFGLLVFYALFIVIIKRIHVYIIFVIGVIGLIDLYYMAIIYVNSAMLIWTNVNTYFLFYSAVFTLGPALALSFIGYPLRKYIRGKLSIKLVMAALLVVFISVTTRLIEHPYMGWLTETTIINDSAIFPHFPHPVERAFGLRMISWCLYIIGMAIWIYALWKGRDKLLIRNNTSILIGTIVMFIAELVNQYTFFIICNT